MGDESGSDPDEPEAVAPHHDNHGSAYQQHERQPRNQRGDPAGEEQVERRAVRPVRERVAAVGPLVALVHALTEGDAIALGADADERMVDDDVRRHSPLVEPAAPAGLAALEGARHAVADGSDDHQQSEHSSSGCGDEGGSTPARGDAPALRPTTQDCGHGQPDPGRAGPGTDQRHGGTDRSCPGVARIHPDHDRSSATPTRAGSSKAVAAPR